MTTDCYFCKLIATIQTGDCPNFVKELETGHVLLGNPQTPAIYGYAIFVSKDHKFELHELAPDRKAKFMNEMSLVAEAVALAFKPKKLNYEMLGNLVPHMHWHIIPRYGIEPLPTAPLRNNPPEVWEARSAEECLPLWQDIKPVLQRALDVVLSK